MYDDGTTKVSLSQGALLSGYTNLPLVINTSVTASNGQVFTFSFTVTEDNVAEYAYKTIPATGGSDGEYSSSDVYAVMMVVDSGY